MPKYGRNPKAGLDPRTCPVCGSSYQPYREDQRSCSRKCYRRLPDVAAALSAYKAQSHIRERKNSARRVTANPARREVNLRGNLRQYGITPDEYRAMVAAQSNRCAICGSEPDPNGVKAAARLHVDHDHVTNQIRALLCCRCNQGIGYFKDDPALFHAAAEYIERHRTSA